MTINTQTAGANSTETQPNINELRKRAKNVRILASDLDGTLLDQKHELSDENRRALETLAKKGVILVAATGRARTSIPETIVKLEGLKYLVSVNGAKIFLRATDEVLYEKYLSPEALAYIRPLLADKDVLCEVFWDGTPHVEEARYNGAPDYGIPFWFSDYFFASRIPLPDFEGAIQANKNKIENINFVFANDAVKFRVRAFLKQRTDLYELTSAFPFNFEIGAAGVSKAAALDFIAEREGIDLDQIIAFGDNANDASMIEHAGIGIATANAVPKVIAAADFVSTDNNHSSVAHALHYLELI